jgi:hypothetical protein
MHLARGTDAPRNGSKISVAMLRDRAELVRKTNFVHQTVTVGSILSQAIPWAGSGGYTFLKCFHSKYNCLEPYKADDNGLVKF